MATVVNEFYVPTPTTSQYEDANAKAVERAGEFSKRNHRLISAIGENANITDKGGLTNFKYLEDRLFSNREVPLFKSSNIDILDDDYIKSCRNNEKCVYKVLRFNRKCNIRTFDFIVTYKQVSAFGANVYKPIVVTKQFKGSFLFTGCSIIRDTTTLEEFPLKLYGKYESIGDTANCMQDMDCRTNAKGGPSFTFRYTFDKDYVYLYIVTMSPFRLVPLANGDFKDLSFAEDHGLLSSEIKPNVEVSANSFDDSVKSKVFEGDIRVWSEINLSLCDTTLSHSSNDAEFIDYDKCADLTQNLYKLRAQEFTMTPTNDGEQVIIGMVPASQINLEVAPDMQCIRFGSNLLASSLDKVNALIDSLSKRIIAYANNIDRVPFTIKTSIRMRGKYNVKGDYFIDSDADKLGEVLITDVGYYDAKTDKFSVKEYIFDKNQPHTYGDMDTVGNYKNYKDNVSDYLTLMSKDGKPIPSTCESREILHVLKNLSFEKGIDVSVYQDIAFIRASVPFEVISAFIEFTDNDDPSDDQVIYICKDCKIRICNFKDYNMEELSTIDLLANIEGFNRKKNTITKVVRVPLDDDTFTYYIGTDNGLIIKIDNISSARYRKITTFGAFDESKVLNESVNLMLYENGMIFVGGNNGNVSIINGVTGSIKYIDSHFNFGDAILGASSLDDSTVVFVSKNEICSYNYVSDKWNYIGDEYHTNALFNNPLKNLPNPNIDYLIDEGGWEGVPTIQKDIYLYALGLRDEHMGFFKPVYKKLNLLTGEVTELPYPEEEDMAYGQELCLDGNTIYCIGGTSRKHDEEAYSDENFKTWISAFDTTTDTWIKLPKNHILIDVNKIRSKFSDGNFHPIANNGEIYIMKPVMYQITKYEESDSWELTTGVHVKGIIKISITENDVAYEFDDLETLDKDILNLDVNCIAMHYDGKYFHFALAERIMVLNSDDTTYSFKGYNIHCIKMDKEYNCTSKTIANVTSIEFEDFVSSDPESLAPRDLFGNSSVYVEYNEAIVYCATKFILYFRTDYQIGRLHAIYHSSGDNASWKPLVSAGEYEALQSYKFSPKNTKFLKIKNFVVLLGGSAGRVPLYLSLDTVTLISAPRYHERDLTHNRDTAILKDDSKLFSATPRIGYKFNESSVCRVGNVVYLLLVTYHKDLIFNANGRSFRAILLKKELGSDSAFKFVKNLSNVLAPTNENCVYGKIAINALDDNTLVFIPAVKYTNGLKGEANLTVTICDLKSNNFIRPINELEDICAKDTIVYSRNGELYIESTNGSYVVRKSNSNAYITSTNANIDFDVFKANNTVRVINAVNVGKYSVFAIAYDKSIVVYALTDTYKVYSVYSIQVENADNPQIYSCGKYVYISTGLVNNEVDSAINPTLYRFSIDDLAIENGGIRSSEKTTLSLGTSEFNIPYIISRDGKITLIGTPFVIDNEGAPVLAASYSEHTQHFTDDNFVKSINAIDVSKVSKSKYNRFNASMLPITVGGNEYVAVLAGKESDETKTTTVVDLYNVQTNSWVENAVELPKTLSHLSLGDNSILGGTYEKHDDATENTFNSALEFVCKDSWKGTFELNEVAYPQITKRPDYVYPIYGIYAKLGSNLFVIPVTKAGNLDRTDDIVNIHIVTGDIEPVMKLGIQAYSLSIKVVAAFIHDQSLILVLHNIETNNLNVWSYNVKTKAWGIVYSNTLAIKPKTKTDASSITATISDTKFININNPNKTKTRAILTFVSDDKADKGIYNIFISESDNGSVNVTGPIRVAGFLGNVDNIVTSKTGKIYIIDDVNNKFHVINSTGIGYGSYAHQLNYIETASDIVGKDFYKNTFFELTSSFVLKIIDEYGTNVKEKQIQIEKNYRKAGLSVLKNVIFTAIDEEHFDILGFVDEDLLFVEVSKNGDEYESEVHVLTDTFNEPINQIYKIFEGYAFALGDEYKLVGCTKKALIEDDKDNFKVILEHNASFATPIDFTHWYTVDSNSVKVYEKNGAGGYYNNIGKWVSKQDYYTDFVLPSRVENLGVHDRTIYVMDMSYNVYELNYITPAYNGFSVITTTPTDNVNNLIFRTTDITDFVMGIRYVKPIHSDDKVYSFSGNIYNCGNDIISINGTDITIRESKTLGIIAQSELKSKFHSGKFFTDMVDKSHHIFIFGDGVIYDTNCETGDISEIKNESITSNSSAIEIKSISNSYVICSSNNSYWIFNSKDKSLTKKEINIDSSYSVKFILDFDESYEHYYALLEKGSKYILGKFNFANNDLKNIGSSLTFDDAIKNVYFDNSGNYIETEDNKVYGFDIDKCSNALILKAEYTKPSFDFITGKCQIRTNSYIDMKVPLEQTTLPQTIDDSYDEIYSILHSGKSMDDSDKVTVTRKVNSETKTVIYTIKGKKNFMVTMNVDDDPLAYDNGSEYTPFMVLDTEPMHNQNTDEIQYVHILALSGTNYKNGKLYNTISDFYFVIPDDSNIPPFIEKGEKDYVIDPTEAEILEAWYNNSYVRYNSIFRIVKTQNNTVNILTSHGVTRLRFNSNYNIPFAKDHTNIDIPELSDNECFTMSVADMVYIINPKTRSARAIMFGNDGIIVPIINGQYSVAVDLGNEFYDSIDFMTNGNGFQYMIDNFITSDHLYFDNTRKCDLEGLGFILNFNCLKEISEYYTPYVGTDKNGNVISTVIPINEYKLSSVVSTPKPNDLAARAVDNIQTRLYLTYDSDIENKMISFDAISKINMTSFELKYQNIDENHKYAGKIVAFTDAVIHDSLVRNDSSFYNDTYAVAIINDNIVKVVVDGETHTYSYDDNSLPFVSKELIPFVGVYGERINPNGEIEPRYYAFFDINGNVASYDKDLKSFIDISGYVNVKIPYFSTQAHVFPSNVNSLSKVENVKCNVWASGDEVPFDNGNFYEEIKEE